MKNFALVFFVICCQTVLAHASENEIFSISRGQNGEPSLVKYTSGLVEIVDAKDEGKLKNFSMAKISFIQDEDPVYEPSIVNDGDIKMIFKRMNHFMRRRSECTDRAHIWAFDEHQKSGIKSQKAFLFLTDSYIRRHRYKWWFHVAPMYTTASGEKIVMDKQFLDRPVTFAEWKNHLVFSKRECVTDFRFTDYNAGADQTQDCYTKAEPMYYRLPGEIGARENGVYKTNWNTYEVNGARSRAFFKGNL